MLKPMDIHNIEFKRVFKGYNPEEVDEFVATIVRKYEAIYQENRRLQEELNVLHQEKSTSSDQKQDVLDLISLTKQTVSELKNMAKQEATALIQVAETDAERIVNEARLEAERLVADAEARLMKTQRAERQLREKVRVNMESIWNILTIEQTDLPEATKPYREIIPSVLEQDDDADLTSE